MSAQTRARPTDVRIISKPCLFYMFFFLIFVVSSARAVVYAVFVFRFVFGIVIITLFETAPGDIPRQVYDVSTIHRDGEKN